MPNGSESENDTGPLPDLRARAVGGLVWSALENWGSKGIAFAVSLVLARLLSPEVFGIASAAMLFLALVPLIAEFGFGDAIVQRRSLEDDDASLPFYLSLAVSLAGVAIFILFSGWIAQWLGIPEYQAYIVAIGITLPLSIPLGFQDAFYRRQLRFRASAVRSLAGSLAAGVAGIAGALAGLGVWTFVVQAYVGTIVMLALLWWRPLWVPGWRFPKGSLASLLRFSVPTVAQRLIDFAGTRVIDLIIILQIGLAAYGMFVMASRLYQTLLQLLQGAFFKVTFALLSQIAGQRERLVNAFEETVAVAAAMISPVFVLLAALAPEICDVMLGEKWLGTAELARPLLLLGAVHCVQYMNGAFLASSGRPGQILITGALRCALQIVALVLFRASDSVTLTWVFVAASLGLTPVSYAMVTRELGIGIWHAARLLFRPWMLAAIAYFGVEAVRPVAMDMIAAPFPRGMVLGAVFASCYGALMFLFARRWTDRCLRLVREVAGKSA